MKKRDAEHLHMPGHVYWEGHLIRLLPGYKASTDTWDDLNGRTRVMVAEVCNPSCLGVDAADPLDPDSDVYSPMSYESGVASTPVGLARKLAAAQLALTAHEVFEFTTVDGELIADAHHRSEEQWAWVARRMERMVDDFCRTFPIEDRVGKSG